MITMDLKKLTPVEADRVGLDYLVNRYSDIVSLVKAELINSFSFDSSILNADSIRNVDWNRFARHLMGCLAGSEVLGIDHHKLISFWIHYSRFRILPLFSLDDAIDKICDHLPGAEEVLSLVKIVLYNLAAHANSYLQSSVHPNIAAFEKIYSRDMCRVMQIVYEEMTGRFNRAILRNPQQMLRQYESDLSPLLRSSAIATVIAGIAEMEKIELRNTTWYLLFEKMRQLLDDLADVWEDLLVGRLTYPVLLALNTPGYATDLNEKIDSLWTTMQQVKPDNKIATYWLPIKQILITSSAFDSTTNLINNWKNTIEDAIIKEDLPGDKEPLLVLLALKAAFLNRQIMHTFDDRIPSYNFNGSQQQISKN